MKWTFFIKHKMAAAMLLGIVIGLVLLNNISEQKNSDAMNENFVSLYEDRLLAESYILKMYSDLHEIDEISETQNLDATQAKAVLTPLVNDINATVELYRATQLTPQEAIEFSAFVALVRDVNSSAKSGDLPSCKMCVNESLSKLSVLSDIQVTEGAKLNSSSERIQSENETTSQFEFAMLIVIGVLIQALIFTTKTIQQTTKQKFGAN